MSDDEIKGTRSEKVTVGVSSSNILPKNFKRKVMIFRNSSAGGQTISINIGFNSAVLNEGIVLSAGQSYSENTSESFECWKGEVQAISDVAGAVLSVFER